MLHHHNFLYQRQFLGHYAMFVQKQCNHLSKTYKIINKSLVVNKCNYFNNCKNMVKSILYVWSNFCNLLLKPEYSTGLHFLIILE